jgi:SanA protein
VKKLFKWFSIVMFCLLICLSFLLWFGDFWISSRAKSHIYNNIEDLPNTDVGLILGTSKYTSAGFSNLYFINRIDAAVELIKAGKIKHIIVSGDNRQMDYNEPMDMKKALNARGIPDSVITLDYAGLRTFDSVVRCKKVFGQQRFVVISQKFQDERAVFIARHFDIEAIAFSAGDVPDKYSLKTSVREYFARTRAMLDVYFTNTKPKFLGEPVEINIPHSEEI